VADGDLLLSQFFGLFKHLLHNGLRDDQGTVVVAKDEIARLDSDAPAGGSRQEYRHVPGVDLPAADGLHRRAEAPKYGKAQRVDPAGIAQSAIDQRTHTALFLHADGNEFSEIADAIAVAGPDRYIAV